MAELPQSELATQCPITGNESSLPALLSDSERYPIASRRDWFKAQRLTLAWLRGKGVKGESTPYEHPYDILTSTGLRIEVKYSPLRSTSKNGLAWVFNIHRHGVVDESQVDYYILRCDPGEAKELLGRPAFHLVVPAPIGATVLLISPRSLLLRWSRYYNNLSALKGGAK